MYSMMRAPFLMAAVANTPEPCTFERRTLMGALLPCFALAIFRLTPVRQWPHEAHSSRIQNPRTGSRIASPAAAGCAVWAQDAVRAQAAGPPDSGDSYTDDSRRPSR